MLRLKRHNCDGVGARYLGELFWVNQVSYWMWCLLYAHFIYIVDRRHSARRFSTKKFVTVTVLKGRRVLVARGTNWEIDRCPCRSSCWERFLNIFLWLPRSSKDDRTNILSDAEIHRWWEGSSFVVNGCNDDLWVFIYCHCQYQYQWITWLEEQFQRAMYVISCEKRACIYIFGIDAFVSV